jgi:hypothetical protein
MENKETLIKQIYTEMLTMDESALIDLNNIYCDSIRDIDSIVYANDEEFFEMLNFSGYRVAQATFYGDYNFSHNWVTFDGYANFKSYQYFTIKDLVERPKVMAEYIADNFTEFDRLFSSKVNQLVIDLN